MNEHQQPEQHCGVDSTTSTHCHPVCDADCNNLWHEPSFGWTMRNKFTAFNPSTTCQQCFPSFLICAVHLLMAVCEDTRRSEVLSDTFVCLVKSCYRPAIRNHRHCEAEHRNKPPQLFCTRCFQAFAEDVITTLHPYNVIHCERVPSSLAEFFISFLRIMSKCQHGCPTEIM